MTKPFFNLSSAAGTAAVLAALALPATTPSGATAAGTTCEDLRTFTLRGGRVDSAQTIAAGAFQPPGARGGSTGAVYRDLPSFCRVALTLTPSADSDIKVEVWLPASGWNRKLQAVGNGGWAGTISYSALAAAVAEGYASVSTDTGHATEGARFAYRHPEKFIDYAYRSEHEMTVAAKAVIAQHYGSAPARSYFNGCSTGGRQALVEASRYPEDFDGIIAGAAANPKAHLDAWRIWMAQTMFASAESVVPAAKQRVLHDAVLAQCDALDGAADGLLENPTRCSFDPGTIQCKAGDEPGCLTAAQVKTVRTIMSPPKHANGQVVFPTYEPGTELGWGRLLAGPGAYDTATDQYKYVVFDNPEWDWRTFDLDRDTAKADMAGDGVLAAVNPNLTPFAQRGGKLLTYHGFADNSIAPQASINFYKSAQAATTAPASSPDWLRLFMVPGMGHCSGGDGPDTFDSVAALEAWVERGTPPAQIIASKVVGGRTTRTRPLCPYPQQARYTGSGSLDEAANFACVAP
ncbi:MAG TPA: tannase/feruloyl esterase family alpha/beta hydrolase [Vicinamibacterales bacterium]|nr:tannase/feruloyl esterase family alpha/beta hydrolase [Vicinamibacterales bacterium]